MSSPAGLSTRPYRRPRAPGSRSRLFTRIHKWLALILGVQMLFWFASGLFFAAFPIERVRSEHSIAELEPASVPLPLAAAGLTRISRSEGAPAQEVVIRSLLGRPVALVTRSGARPVLFDLATGRRLSPLSGRAAAQVAARAHKGAGKPVSWRMVGHESPEYRGALPAWRVGFDGGAGRALYVAADLGTVTARRSDLWRVYDFLWGLHIMDWRGHEDFNSPLLVLTTLAGLILVVSGLVLIPRKMGWLRRR